MRLVTLEADGQARAGLMVGQDVLNLRAATAVVPHLAGLPVTLRAILAAGGAALDQIRRAHDAVSSSDAIAGQLRSGGALSAASQVTLLAPLPDAGLVLSCGVNYRAHIHEMGGALPQEPVAFLKSVHSIVGHEAPIVLPKAHPAMVDWEAEFAAVIGRPCHAASAAEALDYVVGYTMINDVSARDWVPRLGELSGMAAVQAWDRNLLGKQFPSFCPMGPSLALKDEIPDPDAVSFQLKVNGAAMQTATTDDLVFNVAQLIAHYSQFYRFMPGDVITTGSPAGVAMGRTPPAFLKAGDVVEIHADGIGTLRNPVVAEG
jgi:2-keto-4-pentenoate hydratase/2-oxohepta-3-ene-1,7-dioic acid hydratase in catechol pathway